MRICVKPYRGVLGHLHFDIPHLDRGDSRFVNADSTISEHPNNNNTDCRLVNPGTRLQFL